MPHNIYVALCYCKLVYYDVSLEIRQAFKHKWSTKTFRVVEQLLPLGNQKKTPHNLNLWCRDFLALNVYVALCYCKLDYYDVSLEILQAYLQANPQSALAINLKACNHFRLYNGKAAEAELKQLPEASLAENDLVKHNLVVFRNGENALQVRLSICSCADSGRV